MFSPTKHLPRLQEVLQQYQEELESWVMRSSIERIRQQYAWLHASEGPGGERYETLVSIDEPEPLCGRWDIEGTHLKSCDECREFALAVWATAMHHRPELMDIYPRLENETSRLDNAVTPGRAGGSC